MVIPMDNYKIQLLKILPGISGVVRPRVQNRIMNYFIPPKAMLFSYHFNGQSSDHFLYYYVL